MAKLLHDSLADLALELAQLDGGRPRHATLRRAVSTAYYALFHKLADICAFELVGSALWETYSAPYRSLNHKTAKNVLLSLSRSDSEVFKTIAETFKKLQEQRNTADYDPTPLKFGRSETIDLIEEAKRAMTQVDALSTESRLSLVTSLMFSQRS